MWILLSNDQKHDQRLHLCLVRAAKDGHHPKLPLTYSICDEDSDWHNLLNAHFLIRASDEVDSGLAPHFRGDQLGKEPRWHHPETENTQASEFINRHPLIHMEWWDQTRVCQKFFIAFCNLYLRWLCGILWLKQLGWWLWHPVRRAKNIRFVFDWIGSIGIPRGVLLSFGYCILGLVLGLLGGTNLGLIFWSIKQEEWESAHMYFENFESDFAKILIVQISAVKWWHIMWLGPKIL